MRTSEPPDDLTGFPVVDWPVGHRTHRVYLHTDPGSGQTRTPLFFASVPADPQPGGRYDLPAPEGTCYLADATVVCVLEIAADDLAGGTGRQLLAETWLRRRRHVTVQAQDRLGPLADFDAPAAHGHGIAGDVHTTDDRALTQRWAAAVRAAGMAGIRGHARTPPAGTSTTWALFGPAGPAPRPAERSLLVTTPATLHDDRDLLAQLAAHGIDVLPVPTDVAAD